MSKKSRTPADSGASASVLHASWDPERLTGDVRSQALLEREGTLSETSVAATGTKRDTATGKQVDDYKMHQVNIKEDQLISVSTYPPK